MDMKKETQVENGEQFVISYELLHMLHWLLKYEGQELSKLINKSFMKGLEEKAKHNDVTSQIQLSEEMQNSIVDFFTFIEQEIADISDKETTKLMDKDVIETLDHIDREQLDYSTIKSTINKNVEQCSIDRLDCTKAHFLKELLKQWKPTKEQRKKEFLN